MTEILLGSHVGMSGKEMFLGSVKEAAEYGANALMVYTGAPQNTRRKEIGELSASASRFRLNPFGRATFSRHAASRPLPAASVTIGYC